MEGKTRSIRYIDRKFNIEIRIIIGTLMLYDIQHARNNVCVVYPDVSRVTKRLVDIQAVIALACLRTKHTASLPYQVPGFTAKSLFTWFPSVDCARVHSAMPSCCTKSFLSFLCSCLLYREHHFRFEERVLDGQAASRRRRVRVPLISLDNLCDLKRAPSGKQKKKWRETGGRQRENEESTYRHASVKTCKTMLNVVTRNTLMRAYPSRGGTLREAKPAEGWREPRKREVLGSGDAKTRPQQIEPIPAVVVVVVVVVMAALLTSLGAAAII